MQVADISLYRILYNVDAGGQPLLIRSLRSSRAGRTAADFPAVLDDQNRALSVAMNARGEPIWTNGTG
jgi:hypothetical protein